MKTTNVTFAQLQRLLRELHFSETRQKKGWRFEEPKSGTIFLFRPYRPEDKLTGSDLLTARTHLDWRGLAEPEDFDRLLNKTPA
jgi:hypothetical protein